MLINVFFKEIKVIGIENIPKVPIYLPNPCRTRP